MQIIQVYCLRLVFHMIVQYFINKMEQDPSSGLVIAPWGSGGIRISSSGLTVNGTITSDNTINGTSLQENGVTLSSKYTDLSSTQTISGSKTFTNQTAIVWAGTTPTFTIPFYVTDANNTGLLFAPCLPSGGFNSLTQTNDSAIFYKQNGASNPSSGLVINCPLGFWWYKNILIRFNC